MEITKSQNYLPTEPGKFVLDLLREKWKDVPKVFHKTKKVGDEVKIVQIEKIAPSANKALNKGVSKEVFYQFASMVKEEDKARLSVIINEGKFEVIKAVQAFNAPSIVKDGSIKPSTWEESSLIDAPTLATLVKYKGVEKTSDLIFVIVFQFCSKFGKRNDLTETGIKQICVELANDKTIRSLTVGDLKFIFLRASKVLGKKFNIDQASILEIVHTAYIDKTESGFKASLNNHLAEKFLVPREQNIDQIRSKEKDKTTVRTWEKGKIVETDRKENDRDLQTDVMRRYYRDQERIRSENNL